ncbi:hypothetical protein [Thermocrinis minervae]|uniref:hypothetical protein n=1 Tax=Thermocrinis minervae TaxID=381751 RepID=UPI001560C995|nr:hypothetical protein [Thermocrinis minervae]
MEKAQSTEDVRLKELYKKAADHLAEVMKHLYQFDLAIKEIRSLESKGNTQH